MVKGSQLVLKTVKKISNETVTAKPQLAIENLKLAPKIYKETCEINWHLPYAEIKNFVRGLNPYPAAWTVIDNKICKIFSITRSNFANLNVAGAILTDHKKRILVRCADSWLEILELQMEGKRKMTTSDLLRGNPLTSIPNIE